MAIAAYKKFAPTANEAVVNGVNQWFNIYKNLFAVNTPLRISSFMAQAAHETANFKVLEEYATGAAYEGRKDLGNIFKGDGVKFKGRGIFQITGRANYKTMSQKIFGDDRLIANPDILLQPQYAVLSAFHFWNDRGFNSLADKKQNATISRRINGGENGMSDRLKKFETIFRLFTDPAFAVTFLGTAVAEKKKSSNFFRNAASAVYDNYRQFFGF